MKFRLHILIIATLLLATGNFAQSQNTTAPVALSTNGLGNTTVLIIRHAEKPESGDELSREGDARAQAYVGYFKKLSLDSKTLHLDYLFAATDSKASHRPRLTIEPLSQSLGMKIDTRFTDKKPSELVEELQRVSHGTNILVSWRHGGIPKLLTALGADAEKIVPGSKWPDDVFCWLIELRYDEKGQLVESKCLNENLMPGDAGKLAAVTK